MPNRSNSYDTVATNPSQPNPHRTLKRTESRVDKLKRQLSQGAGAWLGLSDQDHGDTEKNAWLQRRAAFHDSSIIMGRGVSQKCKSKLELQDDYAPCPTPRDPLHRPDLGFRWPSPITKPRSRVNVINSRRILRSISEQTPGTSYRHPGAAYDELDTALGRPLSQSSAMTRSSMGTRRKTLYKKDSVAKLAFDGISQALGFKSPGKPRSHLYSAQSRSLPPPSIGDLPEGDYLETVRYAAGTIQEEDSLDDEVFFDNKSHGTSALDLRPFPVSDNLAPAGITRPLIMPDLDEPDFNVRPMASGWRAGVKPKPPMPGTPGVNLGLDEPDFKFPNRMMDKVTSTMLEKSEKRRIGEGIVGRLFHRELKDHNAEVNVKDQLDDISDHRPYFTYWVTFVQIVVFIVSVSVYGIAPIGVGTSTESQDVLVTALYPKTIAFKEPENFWIGPRQMDLIHLGAKYAPCMRKDPNIDELHDKIRRRESTSRCCIYKDNSGCYQANSDGCNAFRAQFKEKENGEPTVCGQDKTWCVSPKGDDWPADITEWPICRTNDNRTYEKSKDDHMSCTILSRPCCIGVKGECQLLTEDHCNAKKGYFHPDATLCSQVTCLGKVCGLINFLNEDHPDQFYRLWLSLLLHAGVFHVILTIVFQALIMRDMEKLTGGIRVAIIYLGAGLGGNLASAIFLPYHVEVGPAGSQFGILSTLWVEVIQSWPLINKPWKALAKVGGFTLALFILGLLPWIDNYAHLFGFIFGLLLSFALLPYVTFGSKDRQRKLIIKIVSIVLVIALYVILFTVFYVTPIRECKGCRYLNCLPFKPDFCENMGVEVEATETKFEWDSSNF